MNCRFLRLTVSILFFCQISSGFAQAWMSGYNYRKKITIDKAKVFSERDLTAYPLLFEITDPDLMHTAGEYGNKLSDILGRDISFALSTSATIPLSFQLEHFNPSNGKLRCWVKIPLLAANSTASVSTSLYFYYGSSTLHNPNGNSALSTWPPVSYSRIWHMNLDTLPPASRNAATNQKPQQLSGGPGFSTAYYGAGKLGMAVQLNGVSDFLTSNEETSTSITLSAWIKLKTPLKEQMIVCNDTLSGTNTNGYRLKINQTGNLSMELFKGTSNALKVTSPQKLIEDTWYFVSATSSGANLSLYVNGLPTGSLLGGTPRLGPGGMVKVGGSKQNTQYFTGTIDELSIEKEVRTAGWLKTVYTNQNNPPGFYTVFAEEYNPVSVFKFTGTKSNLWEAAGNWSSGIVPAPDKKVIITAGKTAVTPGNNTLNVGELIIEKGAALVLANNLEISGPAQVNTSGSITIHEGMELKIISNMVNNGHIRLSGLTGSLVFSGNNLTQRFSGSGTAEVYQLENVQPDPGTPLQLDAPLRITGFVKLTRGILQANRQLTLLSSANSTASLLPVSAEASLLGELNVQSYVSGAYPSPATGRGWRLLSSPVFSQAGPRNYGIQSFQNSLFITGPGAELNGFDPSPQNSGTVYTHDQSRPGSLAEKYVTIANAAATIPLGRGIYVFSRGSRYVSDAYEKQIAVQPFSSPEGYTITHTGWLHVGDLPVQLHNQDTGAEGDGFNLLGNPYPCPIEWGSITKSNLGPFVWLYDPVNKDYLVSDAGTTIIPSGSGFFVKVNSGVRTGMLVFSESAKYIANLPQQRKYALQQAGSEKAMVLPFKTEAPYKRKLTAGLSRGPFRQDYVISFTEGGNDGIDDHDAPKIAEGFVSIAGIVKEHKLAVEEMAALTAKKEILLYVKGWETGSYSLNFTGLDSFSDGTSVTLIDRYLQQSMKLVPLSSRYDFNIEAKIPKSQGDDRFVLIFDPNGNSNTDTVKRDFSDLKVFPNPFNEKLYLQTTQLSKGISIVIYDLYGKVISQQNLSATGQVSELNIQLMHRGVYLVRVLEQETQQLIGTFKVFKE